ncbi:hypothetical protein AYO47_08115 [Planctomyces sp. SCGC AG-212-M04]|nr:hypothetical protein AYO47_08115 [Planctomyces sp. SCGC AG-212-M04]
MNTFPELEELRGLLDALCEDRITPAEIARLEELVLTRPEAEVYYARYLGLFAELSHSLSRSPALNERELRNRLGASDTEGSIPMASDRSSGSQKWRRVWAAAACLAIAASGVLWWAAPWRPAIWKPDRVLVLDDAPAAGPDAELIDENGELLDNTVAVIRADWDAEWKSPDQPLEVGATLPPGRLRLKKGFAEIEFYSGATVVLEAPVDFEIVSSMEAFCWQGKLRATVPPHAQGFTIGSPRLDLIDRGTEFGMRVDGLESTEVHVFEGKVELYDAGQARKAAPQQELTSGHAMRVDPPEAPSEISSDSKSFMTSQELLARSQAEARRRQRAWKQHSESRAKDPSVVVYYTFQPEDDWTRTLENQALNSLPGSDGTVVGCQWTDGRWPGKKALDFRQVSDRVRLTIPGDFEAITMAMWARIDALPNKFNSLLMSDSGDQFEGHWHINSKGTVELGVQGPDQNRWTHYYANEAFRPEMLSRWLHLAVVYDRAGKQVTHFIDGRPVSNVPIEFDAPLRFGDCELGNWNPTTTRKHNHPIRFLTGRVDEFIMYSRALSASEISSLAAENQP